MKYIVGLLGVLVVCGQAWAAPEQMTMYATLSAPIASFWEIKTELANQAVTPKTEFNIGFSGSPGGTITLKGPSPLTIQNLNMEDGTTLEVRAKWLVNTINVYAKGTVDISGYLIAGTIALPSDVTTIHADRNFHWAQGGSVNVNQATVKKIQAQNSVGTTIAMLDFQSAGSTGGSASWTHVACSERENSTSICPASQRLLNAPAP